ARDAAPRDDLVGDLLRDLRIPFLFLAPQLRAPVRVRIVDLTHIPDADHELRERLELRPLVIDGMQRAVHLDAFLDPFHDPASSVTRLDRQELPVPFRSLPRQRPPRSPAAAAGS